MGWPAAGNHIDVRGWYLRPPADPSRDVATVRAKMKARYASLFEPTYEDGARVVRSSSLLTVFMTEAGDIDRAKVEVLKDADVEPKTLSTPEHFVAMGIARERIGPIGTTELIAGHFYRDGKSLRVIYARPRRPNEPEPQPAPPEQPAAAAANDDPAVNRAIAEHYFPDLYTYPKEWPRADPWVLLDREGKVLTTGRRVVMSGRDIKLNIEAHTPEYGLMKSRSPPSAGSTANGSPKQTLYGWRPNRPSPIHRKRICRAATLCLSTRTSSVRERQGRPNWSH